MIDLSPFDVLLLDLNGTFMFNQDRFGPEENYATTYRLFGGAGLADDKVREAVDLVTYQMGDLYRNPACFDNFPSVQEVIKNDPTLCQLNPDDRSIIEKVVAHHELGSVPKSHAEALRVLASRHRLILVSNIWSAPDAWLRYLKLQGLAELFDGIVFSSAHACIKPGRRIYEIALRQAAVPCSNIAFIGDNAECDITLPKSLGMATVHLVSEADLHSPISDWVVCDFTALVN